MNYRILAPITLLGALALTGCESGPPCAEWKTETKTVLVTTYVNNKPRVTPQVKTVTRCVRHEKPAPHKSS